jgi:hypothetical protein
MTQTSPLAAILMVGFLGAFATTVALWITGAAWWALILGYGIGGAVAVLLITLFMAAREGAFDGSFDPVLQVSLATH